MSGNVQNVTNKSVLRHHRYRVPSAVYGETSSFWKPQSGIWIWETPPISSFQSVLRWASGNGTSFWAFLGGDWSELHSSLWSKRQFGFGSRRVQWIKCRSTRSLPAYIESSPFAEWVERMSQWVTEWVSGWRMRWKMRSKSHRNSGNEVIIGLRANMGSRGVTE